MQLAPSLNLGAGNKPKSCGSQQLKSARATVTCLRPMKFSVQVKMTILCKN